jgi:hypothetical protein
MNEKAGGRGRGNDLYPAKVREIPRTPGDDAGYVEAVARLVMDEADKAISWYLEKKVPKKLGAQALRLAAIVAATVAGILLIISGVSSKDGVPLVAPAWASVALALAAAFVAVDKFFGFSTAWMRFLTTEFQIRQALHAFEMSWQIVRCGWKDGRPTDEQVIAALEQCRAFLVEVDGLLKSELDAWVQEFKAALKEIDESVKARTEAAKAQAQGTKTGGANVTVENGDTCADGWTLVVDGGGAERRFRGKTAALGNLAPGVRKVDAAGTIGGKEVRASQAFVVTGGAIADVTLKLE